MGNRRYPAPAPVLVPQAAQRATPAPRPPATPTDQSCPVGALSGLPELMREFGHDPWELLESFGVTQAMMAEPMTPIPTGLHGQILQAAADATGQETFGLLLGQRATLENAGPLKLLVFNAPTARDAVESLVRFVGLWYRGIDQTYTRDRGYACIALAVDAKLPGRNQLLTAYLAALVKHLETIFGRAWRPAQVHLPMRRPRSADAYARFFRSPVLFDQPRHAVFFAETALAQRRDGGDRKLEAFLRQYLGELEAREQPDLIARVRQVIDSLLAGGGCTAARVAGIFAIHRVTLHRYLREAGTTFETLLDERRRETAASMLEHTALPIAEIATALGYSTSGSFVRAFARWNGVTPGAWRTRKPGIRRAATRVRAAPGRRR